MNTDKFYRITSKDLKKNSFNIIANKMEDFSDSGSDSKSSMKQEMCRYKSVKKLACKKHAVDEKFQTQNPCIDTRTDK